MPFILADPQVRLGFSRNAEEVIQNDMIVFGEKGRGSFINTILENYYQDAEATISERYEAYKSELQSTITSITDPIERKNTIVELSKKQLDQLRLKARTYLNLPKITHNNPHRLRQDFYEYLIEDCNEQNNYNSLAEYLRAIIEEYSSLPFWKREQIFYSEICDIINDAIANRIQLKIKASNDCVYRVIPYKILQDPLSTSNYLVGFSYPIDEDKINKRPCTFRIASIGSIRISQSLSGIIHEKDEKLLIDTIYSQGVQFLSSDIDRIVVKFTPQGVNEYNRSINLRPIPVNIEDNIYTFNCSPFQARYYFLKFCENAEIISPEWLRTEFADHYHNAVEMYKTAFNKVSAQ